MNNRNEPKAYRCRNCGKMHYPRHGRCVRCRAWEFDAVPLSLNATLLTFTRIYNLPWEDVNDQLLLGLACLPDSEVAITGQIEADPAFPLQIGEPVAVQWKQLQHWRADNPIFGWVFIPSFLDI